MDFFSAQDRARRQTTWLVVLFTLSVLTICVANTLVAVGLFGPDPAIIAVAVLATLAIVGLGSLWRYVQLASGGGAAVAEMLGGRRLDPNATRLEDRVLLNIVEEMALASGIPVPPVYVLENEHSINAFAAGHSVGEAVIGVNRGTLEQLNRDELQGVIAHEFSHILSGDMRINLKLIAILNGILVLSMIGYFLLRIGGGSGGSRDSERKGVPHLLVLGLAMWLIGTIGLFFSKLIKSAISRQREYLADAAAVQFTRNPEGIAGALKMIAGRGSRLETPEAEAASHMFFGSSTSSWLSTHPPLSDRISRLDPSFQGDFKGYLSSRGRLSATGRLLAPESAGRAASAARPGGPPLPPASSQTDDSRSQPSAAGTRRFPGGFPIPLPGAAGDEAAAGMNLPGRLPFPLNPALLLAAIGNPTTSDVQHAQRLVGVIPESLLQASHEAYSARAVVFALLLDSDLSIRQRQRAVLLKTVGEPVLKLTDQLHDQIRQLDLTHRLPLVEIVQSSLCGLSPPQYLAFRQSLIELVRADEKVDLLEFVLYHVIVSHLDRRFDHGPKREIRYRNTWALRGQLSHLLAFIAKPGHDHPSAVAAAFQAGWEALQIGPAPDMVAAQQFSLDDIQQCLTRVANATPEVKRQVMQACAIVIMHDRRITPDEAELFRAIGEAVDCPVPPLAAGQLPSHEADAVSSSGRA